MIIRKNAPKYKSSQSISEDSFTNKRGIDITQAPPMRDYIADAVNLDVDLDGGLTLRKPIKLYSNIVGNYTKELYDGDHYICITDNAINIPGISTYKVRYKAVVSNLSDANIGDLSNAKIINTITSTVLYNVETNLQTFLGGIANPEYLASPPIVKTYFRITIEATTAYLDYIDPYIPNLVRTESAVEFNTNTAGYYTYALKDTYNHTMNYVQGILAYTIGTINSDTRVKHVTETKEYDFYILNALESSKINNQEVLLKAFCDFNNTNPNVKYYGCWEYTNDGVTYTEVPEFIAQWKNSSLADVVLIPDYSQLNEGLDPEDMTYISRTVVNLSSIQSNNDLISNRPDILRTVIKGYTYKFTIYSVENPSTDVLSFNITKLSNEVVNYTTDDIYRFYKTSISDNNAVPESFELDLNVSKDLTINNISTDVTVKLIYKNLYDASKTTVNATISTVTLTEYTNFKTIHVEGTANSTLTDLSTVSNSDDYLYNVKQCRLVILLRNDILKEICYTALDAYGRLSGLIYSGASKNVDDISYSLNDTVSEFDFEPTYYEEDGEYFMDAEITMMSNNSVADCALNNIEHPEALTVEDVINVSSFTAKHLKYLIPGTLRTNSVLADRGRAIAKICERKHDQEGYKYGEAKLLIYLYNPNDRSVIHHYTFTMNLWDLCAAFNAYYLTFYSSTPPYFGRITYQNLDIATLPFNYYSVYNIEGEAMYIYSSTKEYIITHAKTEADLVEAIRDDYYYAGNIINKNLQVLSDADSIPKATAISYFPYTQMLDEKDDILNEDFINTVDGYKLYYKYKLYTYGKKEFKNNIYISDSNSFITSLLNTVTLPMSQDSKVTSLVPWRDYLIASSENNLFLIKPGSGNTYTSKLINTFIGIPEKDRLTIKSTLNGVIFKSGSKIYTVQPSMYSSDDSILNIIDISKPIATYIKDSTLDNFAFSTEQYYFLCIPYNDTNGTGTNMFKYEYATHIWTRHNYPKQFVNVWMNSIDDIRIICTDGIYYFNKSMDEIRETSSSEQVQAIYGDVLDTAESVTPFNFYLDTGQKSFSMNQVKQFVESKLIFMLLDDDDCIPLEINVYVDQFNKILHVDPSTSSSFWKNIDSSIALGSSLITENNLTDPSHVIKQLFLRYSGKGFTIRHTIGGASHSNFKFYVSYYRFKPTINKH